MFDLIRSASMFTMSDNAERSAGAGSGRGQGVQDEDELLSEIEVKRPVARRTYSGMLAKARKELVAQKRLADRVLLSDAPPHKRQTKNITPERYAFIIQGMFLEQIKDEQNVMELKYETAEIKDEQSLMEFKDEAEQIKEELTLMEFKAEAEQEPEPSTSSGLPLAVEQEPEPSTTSGLPLAVDEIKGELGIIMDFKAEAEIDAEIAIAALSTSNPSSTSVTTATCVNNKNFESVGDRTVEWVRPWDSDDDLETGDDETCLLTDRNVTEPACTTDLTAFQASVLKTEDDANDQALRDILTDDDSYTFNWSKDKTTFRGRREIFSEPSGPTFEVTYWTRPTDVFDKMIDVDFIDLLCTETNRYAVQRIALLRQQGKLSSHSRLNWWTPTDRDEMVAFLAIQILQGLYPLPEEQAYFSFNGFCTLEYFSRIMSYNRFLLLKTMLHFVDNQTLTDTTRLCKIRPVIDYFNDKFSSLYMPAQEILIDESLLKKQGTLSFEQKISSKAARVGVKTYKLCESSSGYLWKFIVCAGKDKPTATAPPDDYDGQNTQSDEDVETVRLDNDGPNVVNRDGSEGPNRLTTTDDRPTAVTTNEDRSNNASVKIVFELIKPLLHRGHTLIMDNFYNSPLLLRHLKKNGTDCFGTLRLNREFVPDSVKTLTKTELRQGEVVTTYCSDLSVMVWRDANLVSMISTYHNLFTGSSDKYKRLTFKPSIVLDYNKTMGGLDRKVQFLSAQPMERKRNKIWYKKLFRQIFNAAILNCFVIYSSASQGVSHRKFRTVLAEHLLIRHKQIDLTTESRRLNMRSSTTGQVTTTTVRRNIRNRLKPRPALLHNHFPKKTGSKYTVCCMCSIKTRTCWKCEECEVNLCIVGCFKAYHKPY